MIWWNSFHFASVDFTKVRGNRMGNKGTTCFLSFLLPMGRQNIHLHHICILRRWKRSLELHCFDEVMMLPLRRRGGWELNIRLIDLWVWYFKELSYLAEAMWKWWETTLRASRAFVWDGTWLKVLYLQTLGLWIISVVIRLPWRIIATSGEAFGPS